MWSEGPREGAGSSPSSGGFRVTQGNPWPGLASELLGEASPSITGSVLEVGGNYRWLDIDVSA